MLSKASLWLRVDDAQEILALGGGAAQHLGETLDGETADVPRQVAFAVLLREQLHHVLGARSHRAGERREAPILEVDDAVGHVENAVVVRDQQHGDALLLGECLHQIHDIAPGLLVERRRRLVGEDDARPTGEGAGDRDALLLSSRELAREVMDPFGEADRLEHRVGALPHLRGAPAVQLQGHLNVLQGAQGGRAGCAPGRCSRSSCAPPRRRERRRR